MLNKEVKIYNYCPKITNLQGPVSGIQDNEKIPQNTKEFRRGVYVSDGRVLSSNK